MKELHNKILEIYKTVLPLLEKHEINFLANGGTCIGACREKGFIPWDDDMDLSILPDDFSKFMNFLNDLPEELMWVKWKGGLYKVRHKTLTHRGKTVFIDFMTLNYVSKPNRFKMFICKLLTVHNSFNWKMPDNERYNKWYIKWPIRITTFWFPTPISRWLYWKVIKSKSKKYIAEASSCFWWPRTYNESRIYLNSVKKVFEDTYIYVPKEFDKYLTKNFGDWKTPINYNQDHYK